MSNFIHIKIPVYGVAMSDGIPRSRDWYVTYDTSLGLSTSIVDCVIDIHRLLCVYAEHPVVSLDAVFFDTTDSAFILSHEDVVSGSYDVFLHVRDMDVTHDLIAYLSANLVGMTVLHVDSPAHPLFNKVQLLLVDVIPDDLKTFVGKTHTLAKYVYEYRIEPPVGVSTDDLPVRTVFTNEYVDDYELLRVEPDSYVHMVDMYCFIRFNMQLVM